MPAPPPPANPCGGLMDGSGFARYCLGCRDFVIRPIRGPHPPAFCVPPARVVWDQHGIGHLVCDRRHPPQPARLG